jgi:hypothetical protein
MRVMSAQDCSHQMYSVFFQVNPALGRSEYHRDPRIAFAPLRTGLGIVMRFAFGRMDNLSLSLSLSLSEIVHH